MGQNARTFLGKLYQGCIGKNKKRMTAKNIENAYVKMERKALDREKRRRKGNGEWKPQLGQKVLVRTQPISDTIKDIMSKFIPLF
jgi:hypothetical protein